MDQKVLCARLQELSQKVAEGLLQLKENNWGGNDKTQFKAADFESWLQEVNQEIDEIVAELNKIAA